MAVLNTSDAIRHSHIEGCVTLSEDELHKMQSRLLAMLDDITGVLDECGIQYTLGGGSVLGAVRHKGFIPWDDDIDINISRYGFDVFAKAFREKFDDKYWLHIPGVTEGYALLFPQIRLKGTSVRTRDDLNNDECGLCIDMFYMENTYDGFLRRTIHGIGCQYYGFITSCRKFYRDRKGLTDLASRSGSRALLAGTRFKTVVGWLYSLRDIDKLVRKADRWNGRCMNNDSRYVTFPAGRRHFWGELRERSTMLPSVPLEFEERLLPCPHDTDSYLRQLYGEYLAIPSEDNREAHIYLEPFILP
ncbi:lipopolysaccharide cholinephosphotransferase [Ruminococcaceae bacterium YRB3002]|nr:lipopolysaccharide cholinephosphotransferase [Ruminococcaceae bacterium YRB3002]